MTLQDRLVDAAKEAMKSYSGLEVRYPMSAYRFWCALKDVHVDCESQDKQRAAARAMRAAGWTEWASTTMRTQFGKFMYLSTPFSPPDELLQNLQSEVDGA